MLEFLAKLSAVDMMTISMSAMGLAGGVISTIITMNAKYYEDQRQLRMTVGDLAQKILALRADAELLNIKALKKQEGMEEFVAAHGHNLRTQLTLARLMIDALDQMKRQATATEYEVLAAALTANGDPAADKYWAVAVKQTSNPTARLLLMCQHAYALMRQGREADSERIFAHALAAAKESPYYEGYVHEAEAKALHGIHRHEAAHAAFDRAKASYLTMPDIGARQAALQALASARSTVGLPDPEDARRTVTAA